METWRLLQNSLDWVERHLAEPINISSMATKASLSPFYFQRIFKKMVGTTPAAYVNHRRLSKAAELLVNTRLPAVEISRQVGYENYETFFRAFQSYFDISPIEQRKKHYHLSKCEKPNLSVPHGMTGLHIPLAADGIVFTLRQVSLEYNRYFSKKEPPLLLDNEWEYTEAPSGFSGISLKVGRYVVCSIEGQSRQSLVLVTQTIRKYMQAVWSLKNHIVLDTDVKEIFCGFLPDGIPVMEVWFPVKIAGHDRIYPYGIFSIREIFLDREINIVGLNLRNSGLPLSFDGLQKMWDKKNIFTQELRDRIPATVYPVVEYGVCLCLSPNYDYIAGRSVSHFSPEIPNNCCRHTLPAGRYIKVDFRDHSFDSMLSHLTEAFKAGQEWAGQQRIPLRQDFYVEVYPHESTMLAPHEMYLLLPIKKE